jgi:hypothetical protein
MPFPFVSRRNKTTTIIFLLQFEELKQAYISHNRCNQLMGNLEFAGFDGFTILPF